MQALAILELADIVEARLIRQMQAHAPVKTDDDEVHVIAQTDARAQGHLLQRVLYLELATRPIVVVQIPHITCIEEHSAVEIAKQPRPVLKVGQELDVARLVEVIAFGRCGIVVTARTDRAYGERSDAVGTANIELLAVRRILRVAIVHTIPASTWPTKELCSESFHVLTISDSILRNCA